MNVTSNDISSNLDLKTCFYLDLCPVCLSLAAYASQAVYNIEYGTSLLL